MVKGKVLKSIIAMLCITTCYTVYMLNYGGDGAIFAAVCAFLGGLGGYTLAKKEIA